MIFSILTAIAMVMAINERTKVRKPSDIPKRLISLTPMSIRELNPDGSKFGLDSQLTNRRGFTPVRQTKNDLGTISLKVKKILLTDKKYINAYKKNLYEKEIKTPSKFGEMVYFNPQMNYFYGLTPKPISPSYKTIDNSNEENSNMLKNKSE
jgi:CxxC motif-containing protein